jgi:hypothetical protein
MACAQGFELSVPYDEIEAVNLRAIGSASQRERPKSFFIPKQISLDLLFFRMMFKHMIDGEHGETALGVGVERSDESGETKRAVSKPADIQHDKSTASTNSARMTKTKTVVILDEADNVPLKAFQRTLERLFYVLRDPRGFDATEYDLDGNGCVGWGEFTDVCRQRNIVIKFSFVERLFYTLEKPESSYFAQVVSTFVLLVIATSSFAFILSTTSRFQNDTKGDDPPEAKPIFGIVEKVCLWIFVVEYVARLVTCPFVRAELLDKKVLLDITTSYDEIRLPSKFERLVVFMFAPANVIDLAAIVPGVVSNIVPALAISGGGFVVLRLIRLTRVFRAPAIREPATVIAVTIHKSAKALFVLCVNLGLGIIIFGSLMYLAEHGDWNADDRTYERKVGRAWNATSGKYEQVKEASPFVSIPYTFWWAIVTATTVGYGDHFPTTSVGYIIAVVTMMFSLVIAALPVGVVGSIFGSAWEALEEDKKNQRDMDREQDLIVKTSLQRYAPFESMSRLLTVDIWNTRFPKDVSLAWDAPSEQTEMPSKGDFMGQARITLDLLGDTEATQEITLPLYPDFDTVKRNVTGNITLSLKWTPRVKENIADTMSTVELTGTLAVTLVSADNLINLNNRNPDSMSNPYCVVICYPKAPDFIGDILQPCVWRAPAAVGTLSPQWKCTHNFDYFWKKPKSAFDTTRWRKSVKIEEGLAAIDAKGYVAYAAKEETPQEAVTSPSCWEAPPQENLVKPDRPSQESLVSPLDDGGLPPSPIRPSGGNLE